MEKTTRITALVSRKGGVGKTTTAVNLAACLALLGRRVLLVDLDPNAGSTLSLGIGKHQISRSTADILLDSLAPHLAIHPTPTQGLELIPASVDLRSVEADLGQSRIKERVLRGALEPLRGLYDFIFLDCPSSLGLLSRNALAACDGFLVPAVPHFLAVEGLEQLVDAAERLRHRCRSATRFLGIVPTVVDYRNKTTRDMLGAIRGRFGARVFAMEIRINVRLAEAPAFGTTIFEYSPDSTGAHAYRLLAEEFLFTWARENGTLELPELVEFAGAHR